MTTFKFRLATVLRVRERTRDERRNALAEALRAEQTLAERLAQLEGDLAQMKKQQTASVGLVNIDRLMNAQRYETVIRMEYATVTAQRHRVAGEIERRRLALVEADRDVRVLEKLRDAQGERFRADEERRAMKILDEIAQRAVAGEAA